MRTVATGNRKYHQRKVKPNCDSDLSGSRRARFHIPGRIKELKEDPAPLGPVTVGAGAPPSPTPTPGSTLTSAVTDSRATRGTSTSQHSARAEEKRLRAGGGNSHLPAEYSFLMWEKRQTKRPARRWRRFREAILFQDKRNVAKCCCWDCSSTAEVISHSVRV